MSIFKKCVKVVAATVLGLGVMVGASGAASACDYGYHTVYVTSYETRVVPHTVCVTKYDCYGNAYVVHQTVYSTVSVPVQRAVQVAYGY